MSDFAGMEDLLQDFLVEATDLLSGVDNKLVDLEKNPQDHGLLNDIFRGFHTIKGGAGFLNAAELVTLCHLTENLFDKLRNGEMTVSGELMDVIMAATATVREMFGQLEGGVQPGPAEADLIASLKAALAGELVARAAPVPVAPAAPAAAPAATASTAVPATSADFRTRPCRPPGCDAADARADHPARHRSSRDRQARCDERAGWPARGRKVA